MSRAAQFTAGQATERLCLLALRMGLQKARLFTDRVRNKPALQEARSMLEYKDSHGTVFTDTESPRPPGTDQTDRRLAPGGWTFILVLAGVTCCLGSAVPAGFNIGVMNNAAHLMKNACNESLIDNYGVHLSESGLRFLWSGVVSIFLIGGVTGSFLASWLADRYGRKPALCVGNVCGILGGLIFLVLRLFNAVEILLLGRLIVGFSGGFATSLLPLYMSEVAPLRLRGAVGVLCQLGITCGVFLGQIAGLDSVLGKEETWPYMLGSFVPLCIFALVCTAVVLPESPKYLYIIKEQREKALAELSRIRNMDMMLLQTEISHLQQEVEMKTSSDPWTLARVLRDPALTLPVFLVCFIQFGQQLSGINVVFYYSSTIFMNAGLGVAGSQYATLGTGVANIAMALVSVPVMSALNRRTVLTVSIYSCIVCLVILCVSILTIHMGSFIPWICTATMLMYVILYGFGLGPIPFFIGSELFDVGPRPLAMALGSVFNWGGNFLVGMMFPPLEGVLGAYTFLIFVGFLVVLAQVVRVYLPETRGRDTIEITATISHGFRSKPNAVQVA